MDFTLSKEHEMARQLFKDFAETEVKPLAQEVDEEERFPRDCGKNGKVRLSGHSCSQGVWRAGLRHPDLCYVRGGAFQGMRDNRRYCFRTYLPLY